jgi:outer membrane protein assembly factor BamB
VYVFGDEGACAIVAAGPEYRLLARNELGEGCQASPAFAAGRMFIRGEEHLFCIGKASDAAAAQSGKPGGAQ